MPRPLNISVCASFSLTLSYPLRLSRSHAGASLDTAVAASFSTAESLALPLQHSNVILPAPPPPTHPQQRSGPGSPPSSSPPLYAPVSPSLMPASFPLANFAQMRLVEEQARSRLFTNALDPLLEQLSADYVDDSDLSASIQTLFAVCIERVAGGD